MTDDNNDYFVPKVLKVQLEMAQYPILCKTIRQRMREEIFSRGVITREIFEKEVYQKALQSQKREGLLDPYFEEQPQEWNERYNVIQEQQTDFYFAHNLPHDLFEKIVQGTIAKGTPNRKDPLTFNPEIAPWDLLFSEGARYERLPLKEQTKIKHHLKEIKAVLVKSMISTDLRFIALAREAFTVADLRYIRDCRIGRGKIGGKAAGILLAWKLLKKNMEACGCDPDIVQIPESFFVASDVFYEVQELNNLFPFMNQKYRAQGEILSEYPTIYNRYLKIKLPGYVVDELRELLEKTGSEPLIFRSSSLLEDSFETSFAGKYDSFFLPNQGTLEENLEEAINAIRKIYASTLGPDALIYRKQMGLIDFDERMGILIQKVEGQRFGRYFFPSMAGVGFSRNPFRWNARIRREDGLLRLVCGMGTRAVDRVANDYPRMIALSHPKLRPESTVTRLRRYSQRLIDVIDLEENVFKTLPIGDVVGSNFPALQLVASQDKGDYLQPFTSRPMGNDLKNIVFTFDQLLEKTNFAGTMRDILSCLQQQYGRPVDIEYAVDVVKTWPEVQFSIRLLQCRPLSQHEIFATSQIPKNIPDEDKLFAAKRQVPDGIIERIRYIALVKPTYHDIIDPVRRLEVGRVIGRLNEKLQDESFILMGPGRWGTSDIYLGVKVSYADIYNSRALIEIALPHQASATPEMAYGTHFFQDLVEAKIFPLALYPNEPEILFNWAFFEDSSNSLLDLLPNDAGFEDYITVIDIPAVANGRMLEIIMSADQDEALAYLKTYPPLEPEE
jgi:hypothetical protein